MMSYIRVEWELNDNDRPSLKWATTMKIRVLFGRDKDGVLMSTLTRTRSLDSDSAFLEYP